MELIPGCGIEEKSNEIIERRAKVPLWCVQNRPELRPMMSVMVKMLEGSVEIPEPVNLFQHLMGEISIAHPVQGSQTYTSILSGSSVTVTDSSIVCATPIMKKYAL